MTAPTQTLIDRALSHFGDDVTWVLPDAVADLGKIKNLRAVHPFRPDFLAMQNMGVKVTPDWPEEKSQTIALCLPRQAEWACGLLAEAFERLPEGGKLLMIAPNDLGGKRYARLLEENFGADFAESKNHCRLVAVTRPAALPDIVNEWKTKYRAQKATGTELLTMPGVFSHGRVDAGSALLAKHLPALSGNVADFGAGWGYLAHHMLQSKTPPARIDLFEADHHALGMAKQNLAAHKNAVRFFWHDIIGEKTPQGYDAVVMNPPFHDMKAASHDIGRAFISAAAAALKDGGQLWMVANTHLPYEEILKETFGSVTPVTRESGFKVLSGRK